jgi:hypothetical protein
VSRTTGSLFSKQKTAPLSAAERAEHDKLERATEKIIVDAATVYI